ncbi:CotY/CotZ family spore coat protein [Peribacillus alkalitolerans]|uniref:CotY/CotZ family spore coat protein n=1 Tax=Peribacillus alkalitolerans TaxID=1550385 RepID=UPI0013D2CD71|nr:CotY/CotZ family spore coat protein [Peribacillus alkalitolerans]
MGCGNHRISDSNDCIVDTLAAIADAQDRVDDRDDKCRTSCDMSIDELVSPTRSRRNPFDTIPVLLTVEGQPFEGVGARRDRNGCGIFDVVRSFLFRVNDVDEKNGCAQLELLELDPCDNGSDDDDDDRLGGRRWAIPVDIVTDFDRFLFRLDNAERVIRSGVCITVDLDDFTSVSCLPPVRTFRN